MLPDHFCWTRFGTEAGEDIGAILARKERERLSTGGIFLWGIGNSVGPAIADLVRLERNPSVVFSPMRSRPKMVDVAPSRVLEWIRAIGLDGTDWPMPEGVSVTSRANSEAGRSKRAHYALVCRSATQLGATSAGNVEYESLVNLKSHNKLGASQVTAVVKRLATSSPSSTVYPVAFVAELAYPYFLRLEEPVDLGAGRSVGRGRERSGWQQSLVAGS